MFMLFRSIQFIYVLRNLQLSVTGNDISVDSCKSWTP